MVNQAVAFIVRYRTHARAGRNHHRALDNCRAAFCIEERNQRFTGAQRLNGGFGIKGRIDTHGLRRGFHRFLIFRRKGAQGVLHAVTQLPQYVVRNIRRVLRHKPDPDAFGADQADNLFNFIQQHLRRVVKQQVRFVKEEHQFGFFQIACFRQLFVQFREHPQQAGGVKLRHLVELLCAQNVDDAFAAAVGTHPVFDIQHWLAEEVFGALLLQRQEPALNGAH